MEKKYPFFLENVVKQKSTEIEMVKLSAVFQRKKKLSTVTKYLYFVTIQH